jgi:hypothetical protein
MTPPPHSWTDCPISSSQPSSVSRGGFRSPKRSASCLAAERKRHYRERRRRGLSCIKVQLLRKRVEGLHRCCSAPRKTPTVTRNRERVTIRLPGVDHPRIKLS